MLLTYQYQDATLRKNLRKQLINDNYPSFLLIALTVFLLLTTNELSLISKIGFGMILFGIIFSLYSSLNLINTIKRNIKNQIENTDYSYFTVENEIEIVENIISITDDKSKIIFNKDSISSLVIQNNHIIIFLNRSQVYIIPRGTIISKDFTQLGNILKI